VETTVPRQAHPRTHRFVVVYRIETREIPGAVDVRRGWIERVPDPREVEADQADRSRLGFQELNDLPVLITRMIAQVEARRPGDRRPA
jgi:hypothetical protein